MSNPKDVTHPRSPLTLSKANLRPQTSREEMARKLYGTPKNEHAAPLASAFPMHLSDDLGRYPGTDYLGVVDVNAPFGGAGVANIPGPTLYGDSLAPAASAQRDVGPEAFRRIKLARDRDRPLEFDGRVKAEVQELTFGGQVALRAAIYETRGGKFVAEVTRRETVEGVDYGTTKRPFLFAKATVFDNLDLAAMSFRTQGGRLTEQLLRQIGDVDSEFIE